MVCAFQTDHRMFAVGATAVLPYSDDGASGEGLQLSCVATEEEAVATAVRFLTYFRTRMYAHGSREAFVAHADELCAAGRALRTFDELDGWVRDFHDVISAYALSDPAYQNPNHILNLVIRDVHTNSPVAPFCT